MRPGWLAEVFSQSFPFRIDLCSLLHWQPTASILSRSLPTLLEEDKSIPNTLLCRTDVRSVDCCGSCIPELSYGCAVESCGCERCSMQETNVALSRASVPFRSSISNASDAFAAAVRGMLCLTA